MRSNRNLIQLRMRSRGQLWKPVTTMVFISFAFALVNVLFKKILDDGTNRMVVATYRLAIATVFLAPIACFLERKDGSKLTAAILSQLFFSALIGASLVQYFFLLGLEYTSVTFALAFTNMVPAVTFALALLFRQEKVNMKSGAGKAKVLGTLVCIGGALLLSFYKGMALNKNSYIHTVNSSYRKIERWAVGSVLLMIGVTLWSLWFVIQAKISQKYTCQYTSTAILSFFGAIQSAMLSLITERNTTMWVLKGAFEIIAVVYSLVIVLLICQGMVGSGLCYVGMSWCLRTQGPVFTSAFAPFVQMFAAIFSFTFLHEQIYLGSVVGSVVVIVGLYLLLLGKSKDREEPISNQVQLPEDPEDCNTSSNEVAIDSTRDK